MMSKGFLIFADNNPSNDYHKMAYALALSIKNTQKKINSVTLVTTQQNVDHRYSQIFDKIIVTSSLVEDERFKTSSRSSLYELSPYDQTVVLDSDMIFTDDISRYWNYLEGRNLYYTSSVKDYRGNFVDNIYYRKDLIDANLPIVYNALYYFKKSDYSKKFFDLVSLVNSNWKDFYKIFFKNVDVMIPSMDVTTAIALSLMDIVVDSTGSVLSFVHMKPMLQDWDTVHENWTDVLGIYFNKDGKLKLGNYLQPEIIHYVEETFLTDDILEILEKNAR
jgi:hypothetical protein